MRAPFKQEVCFAIQSGNNQLSQASETIKTPFTRAKNSARQAKFWHRASFTRAETTPGR